MLRNIKEEGHYTIKRVDTLPKKGNANWLYILKGTIVDRLYRWDAFDKEYQTIFINSQGFIPEDTILAFDSNTNMLSITFTDGTMRDTFIDIKGYVTTYTDTTGLEKSKIGEYLNENGDIVNLNETNTNVRLEGNSLFYTREDQTETELDLSLIIQQGLDVALASATYVESLSTIVLTKNNGENVSVTLTGLGNTISNTSELTNDSGFITLNEIPNETLTSLSIIGSTLNYQDEDGNTTPITLPTLSGGSGVQSVTAGTNITVDNTDPLNPIVSSTASGGTSSSTGLEAIDEGTGIGWRLIGRNPANYGRMAENAVDLSISTSSSSIYGATGVGSYAEGLLTTASNSYSHAEGVGSTASGVYSHAEGRDTTASGTASHSGGSYTTAISYAETSIGSYNTLYTPNNISNIDVNDKVFNVGNGSDTDSRSDAFTVWKSGAMQLQPIDLTAFTPQLGMIAIDVNDNNKLKFYDGTIWNALF